MTRINVVDPKVLTDQHLLAEYREMPRVITASEKHFQKHGTYIPIDQPSQYVLGTGHMKFFYDKHSYLWNRHIDLVNELIKRGFKPTFSIDEVAQDMSYVWEPRDTDRILNARRLSERIRDAKSNPMYYRKEIDRTDAIDMILDEFTKQI